MARPTSKPLAELVVPDLDNQLRAWRRQGLSWETMAQRLAASGVPTTGRTVARWYADMFEAAS